MWTGAERCLYTPAETWQPVMMSRWITLWCKYDSYCRLITVDNSSGFQLWCAWTIFLSRYRFNQIFGAPAVPLERPSFVHQLTGKFFFPSLGTSSSQQISGPLQSYATHIAHQAATADQTSSVKRRGKSAKPQKAADWSVTETNMLLHAWAPHFQKLKSVPNEKRFRIWNEIYEQFKSECAESDRTLSQIKKRQQNFEYEYKQLKLRASKTGKEGLNKIKENFPSTFSNMSWDVRIALIPTRCKFRAHLLYIHQASLLKDPKPHWLILRLRKMMQKAVICPLALRRNEKMRNSAAQKRKSCVERNLTKLMTIRVAISGVPCGKEAFDKIMKGSKSTRIYFKKTKECKWNKLMRSYLDSETFKDSKT